jgi:acetylornithine deacetylase/succinyl-diaminopimelate desuccinylase-like protein
MRDSHLQDFYTFLRFPSISTDDAYSEKLGECAHWLVEKLNGIGLEAQRVSTPGHPVVWAKNKHQPGRKTVMLYGHYDVQPPDPLELWDSPPFEPVLKNGYVYARGATDNKGQILAHILGIQEVMAEHGDLPVNLHLIIEGEEEIGSNNLPGFLKEHRAALKCDVAIVSDTGMIARGVPTLSYGLRGVTACEVKVTGAKMDLHSGVFGGAVANSVTALARLLATLHDENGRVAIDGFYDDVKPLEEWEREAWRKLPIDGDKEILAETGAPALFGEKGFSTLERLWARPTAEINGIGGGYQGKGTKTVIASHAMAKLTFRLVPNQDGDAILKLARKHLEKHRPPGVTMEITDGHSGPWYLTDPHSTFGRAAQHALKEAFKAEVALIREGGSIPIVSQFRDILGVETLLLGLALPNCRAHSPNENFPLENLEAGIKMNKAILQEVGAGGP